MPGCFISNVRIGLRGHAATGSKQDGETGQGHDHRTQFIVGHVKHLKVPPSILCIREKANHCSNIVGITHVPAMTAMRKYLGTTPEHATQVVYFTREHDDVVFVMNQAELG